MSSDSSSAPRASFCRFRPTNCTVWSSFMTSESWTASPRLSPPRSGEPLHRANSRDSPSFNRPPPPQTTAPHCKTNRKHPHTEAYHSDRCGDTEGRQEGHTTNHQQHKHHHTHVLPTAQTN